MTHLLLSLADISPLAWMSQGLMQLNTSLLVLGFTGLLLGILFAGNAEDPSDMY